MEGENALATHYDNSYQVKVNGNAKRNVYVVHRKKKNRKVHVLLYRLTYCCLYCCRPYTVCSSLHKFVHVDKIGNNSVRVSDLGKTKVIHLNYS
jgi:hypothetical protein